MRPSSYSVSSRVTEHGEACVVRYRNQFISPIIGSSTNGGFTGGQTVLPIDSVSLGSSRLINMSSIFLNYRHTRLTFDFVPSCSVIERGAMVLAYLPDGNAWLDVDFYTLTTASMSEIKDSIYATLHGLPVSLTINPQTLKAQGATLFYTDYGTATIAANNRQSTQGTLFCGLNNQITGVGYGDLFIEGEIEFYNPTPKVVLGISLHRPSGLTPNTEGDVKAQPGTTVNGGSQVGCLSCPECGKDG